jgi:hypothetical protein
LNFDALHFVFRGQLLSPDRTFEDYGMKDNDPIVPVPIAKGGEAYMNRWINMTGDIDNFQKRVESLLNPNLCPETMRLRDISFTKIEGSARRYRRLMGFFNAPHEGPSCAATPVSSTNLAFAAATRPCCMPMPTPWSQDD